MEAFYVKGGDREHIMREDGLGAGILNRLQRHLHGFLQSHDALPFPVCHDELDHVEQLPRFKVCARTHQLASAQCRSQKLAAVLPCFIHGSLESEISCKVQKFKGAVVGDGRPQCLVAPRVEVLCWTGLDRQTHGNSTLQGFRAILHMQQ